MSMKEVVLKFVLECVHSEDDDFTKKYRERDRGRHRTS